MNTQNLLIIFVRNPELGKVKTRLARSTGNQTAFEIYKMLLQKTKEVTQHLNCDKVVYYSEDVIKNDIWDADIYTKRTQLGIDLGDRMQNAFAEAFEEHYKKVVIIGSDLYDLEPKYIDEAFKKLSTNDVVLGPALDGGYYLLGLSKMISSIFENKKWGTASVLKDTLDNLKEVNVHLLQSLNDIDVIDDIENHPDFAKFLKLS